MGDARVYRLHRLFLDSLADNALAQNIFAPLASSCTRRYWVAEELWQCSCPLRGGVCQRNARKRWCSPSVRSLPSPCGRAGLPAPQAMMPAGGQSANSQRAAIRSRRRAGLGRFRNGARHRTSTTARSRGALGPAPPPPNVVRSILGVVTELRPVPVLLPDLLSGLAASHNAWHVVLQVMEHRSRNGALGATRLGSLFGLGLRGARRSDRLRALQQRACAARGRMLHWPRAAGRHA